MVFFPEYTDHGISHIELTLQTALDLANAPSRGLLTPVDAAVLTLAVSLHDFGMHLKGAAVVRSNATSDCILRISLRYFEFARSTYFIRTTLDGSCRDAYDSIRLAREEDHRNARQISDREAAPHTARTHKTA
ncbi:HD domain-containing protein [Bradyrhizobium embrapense]